ncbi:bifunctional hydroxymethylpyrimidine kinase/phosphomethylpyrimidine kinase [Agromyces atrinae]|uniref:bifunctional hydroxymethylpyrimidine kinase/phosphomethylpyrimidine kinase n=1 Tax=Agromyces atrinae TaxID=592376 RepID=UPI001F59ABD5|nr:bifunctional hydroxymethylpyrimidine kinase/phosphomethylpyrimidine kinase [Agromyces atrinae]MCI2956363.1 bifunctional hydroxymethylpyrimidine kinase/phosphomethylpyrimidine kinase [Agromyces atrinae]
MTGIPRVLSIAGTDPTGGAGIQADLKSIAANGGYGMAVVTALVAQNTHGVRSVHVPPLDFLAEQLDAVSDDVEIDAVKIGMLADAGVIGVVEAWLERVQPPIVVLDPVMVATSGDRLLDANAEAALRQLLSRATLVTPNIPELAILADEPRALTWADALAQAERLSERHGVAVVAKGGHLDGDAVPDAVVDASESDDDRIREVPGTRIVSTNTHGTGCSLSSALATLLPRIGDTAEALAQAKCWLAESIRYGADLHVGSGNGPVSHFAGLWARGGLEARPTAADLAATWWNDIADIRRDIDDSAFVRGLAAGDLDDGAFRWYLAQDAIYLRAYARVLAEASRLAPTAEEQAFWATSAAGSIEGELALHEGWLGTETVFDAEPSRVTTAYLDHLAASAFRGDYGVLIAALLPCFWLYHDAGLRLRDHAHDSHPYRSWLETYADPAFTISNERAIGFVANAAARASDADRSAMFTAFRASAAHERAFFDAPLTGDRDARL